MIIIKPKKGPLIIQMQIDDYISPKEIEVYDINNAKDRDFVRNQFDPWIPRELHKRKYRQRANLPQKAPKRPKALESYIYGGMKTSFPRACYFKRFKSPPKSTFDDFAAGMISEKEWDMLQSLPKFTGFFNHLFEFVDFSYFDAIQAELEAQGADFKGMKVFDIVVFHLFSRSLGFRDYTGLEKLEGYMDKNPLGRILHNPDFFPTAADISYVMTRIPPDAVMTFFYSLVREAIEIGLIEPRILLLDGQFIHSGCNNNKNKAIGRYNDADAGYCRHNGVKKGVGYDPGCVYAYCGPDRTFPVHFTMLAGNRNDNPAFRRTLNEFLNLGIGQWDAVVIDTGAYSMKTFKFCESRGVYPIIRAKKNLKTQPTRELKKGYWFNTAYIPSGWTDAEMLEVYEARPMIEKAHAPNNTFYNAQRMNTRGLANAIRHRGFIYILDLARAITAQKLGRPDLTNKLRAFSGTREAMSKRGWADLAGESGFRKLDAPGQSEPTEQQRGCKGFLSKIFGQRCKKRKKLKS